MYSETKGPQGEPGGPSGAPKNTLLLLLYTHPKTQGEQGFLALKGGSKGSARGPQCSPGGPRGALRFHRGPKRPSKGLLGPYRGPLEAPRGPLGGPWGAP